mmetsp:Transcript_35045/g.103796  ORF Transcript_35045/g.103796 Transcript_35045/m.103796 type:complete len:203 (+) Transcript_35045:427-1035(+)
MQRAHRRPQGLVWQHQPQRGDHPWQVQHLRAELCPNVRAQASHPYHCRREAWQPRLRYAVNGAHRSHLHRLPRQQQHQTAWMSSLSRNRHWTCNTHSRHRCRSSSSSSSHRRCCPRRSSRDQRPNQSASTEGAAPAAAASMCRRHRQRCAPRAPPSRLASSWLHQVHHACARRRPWSCPVPAAQAALYCYPLASCMRAAAAA